MGSLRQQELANYLSIYGGGYGCRGLQRLPLKGCTVRMYNPPHPGEVIKSLCLEPLGITVTQAADALGVSRKTLSAILNGRAGISPEMAVRLSIAFSTTAESWMNQQTQYDLWHAEQRRKRLRVMKLSA
jgi:antitoxin HigA-1